MDWSVARLFCLGIGGAFIMGSVLATAYYVGGAEPLLAPEAAPAPPPRDAPAAAPQESRQESPDERPRVEEPSGPPPPAPREPARPTLRPASPPAVPTPSAGRGGEEDPEPEGPLPPPPALDAPWTPLDDTTDDLEERAPLPAADPGALPTDADELDDAQVALAQAEATLTSGEGPLPRLTIR